MLIDRTHKSWAIFTVAATVLMFFTYAVYRYYSFRFGGTGPSGGSWPGLMYGFVGFGLMVFCGLLGIRKRLRIWRLGRATTWMRAHIWLGLLSAPIIFCHSAMRMGNGLSLVLMVIFVIVMISGIVGVALQYLLPTVMLDRLHAETTFEQIPQVIQLIREEADELITRVCGPLDAPSEMTPALAAATAGAAAVAEATAGRRNTLVMQIKKEGLIQGKTFKDKPAKGAPLEGSEPLKILYVKDVRPFLGDKYMSRSKLAHSEGSFAYFEYSRALLPEPLHEILHDLQSICDERRQLADQQRLHSLLHGWLFVHVPLSYMLLVLAVIHAIVATIRF